MYIDFEEDLLGGLPPPKSTEEQIRDLITDIEYNVKKLKRLIQQDN